MKIKLFCLSILAVTSLMIVSNTYSFNSLSEDELKSLGFKGYQSTNTDSPNYIFKRASEELKFRFFLRDKNTKAKYLSELLDRRFKEVVYTANFHMTGVFENTISRYNTTAGKLLSDYKDLEPNIKTQVKSYIPVLERMRDLYESNSSYWIMVQQVIDTTRRL